MTHPIGHLKQMDASMSVEERADEAADHARPVAGKQEDCHVENCHGDEHFSQQYADEKHDNASFAETQSLRLSGRR